MTYTGKMIREMGEGKAACEIIQDLMPSYIDGLASESTEKLIEEHIRSCAECRRMLENMRSGNEEAKKPDDRDRREIDFLKKSRRKSKRAVVLGVMLTLLVAAAAAGAKLFLIGSEYRGNMACDIKVSGNTMTVDATSVDSLNIIHGLDFTMEGGAAVGTARAVKPGICHSDLTCDWSEDFSFDVEISEVRIGDRIYWSGGRPVSEKASELFMAGHEYVGDAPANGASVDALCMTEDLGSFYSELETDKEPYVWRIILDEDQTKYRGEYLAERLEGYAYALIGTVGNLSEVDFRYTADGKTEVKKVTAEEASEFLGRDIKACRSDAGALSELMEKAGLE